MFEPPLVLNPDPEAETAEMLRLELPVFVRVISFAADVPTSTFPKLRLELVESTARTVGGVELLLAVVDVLPADGLVDPPQPMMPSITIKTIAKMSLRALGSGISAGILKPCASFPC